VPGEGAPSGRGTFTERVELSLGEAVRIALENNLALRHAQERTREARAMSVVARSELLPEISGYVAQRRNQRSTAAIGIPEEFSINAPAADVEDITVLEIESGDTFLNSVFDSRVRASSPVFDVQSLRKWRSARANERLTAEQVGLTEQEVVADTATTYYQLVRDTAGVRLLREKVELNRLQLNLLRDRLQSGLSTELDVAAAAAQLSETRAALQAAESAAYGAALALTQVLGIASTTEIVATDPLAAVDTALPSLEEAVALALGQRPELRVQREAEQVARNERDAARAAYFPVIDVFGDYGRSGEEPSENEEVWQVGAQLNLPLWDSFQRKGLLEQKESRLVQSEIRTRELEQAAAAQVKALWFEVAARDAAVEASEERVALAEKRVQFESDKFESGNATELDIIAERVRLAEARFEEAEKLYEFQKNRIQLFHAMGETDALFDAGSEKDALGATYAPEERNPPETGGSSGPADGEKGNPHGVGLYPETGTSSNMPVPGRAPGWVPLGRWASSD